MASALNTTILMHCTHSGYIFRKFLTAEDAVYAVILCKTEATKALRGVNKKKPLWTFVPSCLSGKILASYSQHITQYFFSTH